MSFDCAMASSGKVWAELVSHGNAEWAMRFVEGEARAFTVGRHPTSSLVLEDKHISSKHLSVAQRADAHGRPQVYVEDSSTNGTWLNGDRLSKGERVTLADGAEIQLPSDSSTMRKSTPRKKSSSKMPELKAMAMAGSMKFQGFNPSIW